MIGHQLTDADILFANKLASKFYKENTPKDLEFDDLRACAYVGLCEAAKRFDTTKGQTFSSFAFLRIRGAMFDSLRKIPTNFHQNTNAQSAERSDGAACAEPLAIVSEQHSHAHRRSFLNSQFYDRLGIRAHRVHNNSKREVEISYSHDRSAEEMLHLKRMKLQLRSFIQTLNKVERKVVMLRYFYEKTFDEIGAIMGGRSKAWVSGIHRRAVDALELDFIDLLQPQTQREQKLAA